MRIPAPAVPNLRPRRRLSSAARRDQLLQVALAEFATRGYHLTQMDHVASAAGVSKALLYQHFDSKEDLFTAVSGRLLDMYVTRLSPMVAGTKDAFGAWRQAVALLVDLVEEQPQSWALVVRVLEDPDLNENLHQLRDNLNDGFAEMLVGFYERGDLPPDVLRRRARLTVPLVVGGVQGLLSWWLEHPQTSRAEIERSIVEFGWLGLDRMRSGERLKLADGLD